MPNKKTYLQKIETPTNIRRENNELRRSDPNDIVAIDTDKMRHSINLQVMRQEVESNLLLGIRAINRILTDEEESAKSITESVKTTITLAKYLDEKEEKRRALETDDVGDVDDLEGIQFGI